MQKLTEREERILSAIRTFCAQKGYAPSVRELCAALGYRSTSTVHLYLDRLEQLGYLRREGGKSRSIALVSTPHAPEWDLSALKTANLFRSPEHTLAADYLMQFEYPWQALAGLKDFICALGKTLSPAEYEQVGESVWISKRAKIAPTAAIDGPAVIIGPDAEIRHCALIRENVLIGAGVNVGHCTGVKNAILFDEVQVPHYNYVGDSILGYRAHMGGAALTSNLKSDKSNVRILVQGERIDTGRQKLGAMLGDYVEIGAGAVLNPGTVIGEHSNVYPLVTVRGYVPPHHIFKSQENVVPKIER